MFGTARRDLMHFQRGAGYASGLDPFQGGGNRKRKESSKIKKKKTLHEMYCSKNLHGSKRKSEKNKVGEKVELRRSSRVPKPKMRGYGKKRGQKGGFGFLAGLANGVVNGLANLVVSGLNGVVGGFASGMAGQQGKGKSRKNVGVMYKALKSSTAKSEQHGSGKKGKAFLGKLKKVAGKVVRNPEVRRVAKSLLKKAANKGIDMVADKATQIKMVKDLMSPAHLSKLKTVVGRQIDNI